MFPAVPTPRGNDNATIHINSLDNPLNEPRPPQKRTNGHRAMPKFKRPRACLEHQRSHQ